LNGFDVVFYAFQGIFLDDPKSSASGFYFEPKKTLADISQVWLS